MKRFNFDTSFAKYLKQLERNVLSGRQSKNYPNPLLRSDLIGEDENRCSKKLSKYVDAGYLEPQYGKRLEERQIVKAYRVLDLEALMSDLDILSIRAAFDCSSVAMADHVLGETHPQIIEAISKDWATGKTWNGFSASEHKKLAAILDLAAAAISGDSAGEGYRAFSARVAPEFGSKFLEQNFAIVSLVINLLEETDSVDPLESFGIVKSPSQTFLAGAFNVKTESGEILDFSQIGYFSLSRECGIVPGDIRAVITIENWESFVHQCTHNKPPGLAVIFTGGYASSHVKSLLCNILDITKAKWFHWGDIDPHGICIAANLSSHTGREPILHLMDMEILDEKGVKGTRPMRKMALREARRVPSLRDLADYFWGGGDLWLEQEVIPSQSPI